MAGRPLRRLRRNAALRHNGGRYEASGKIDGIGEEEAEEILGEGADGWDWETLEAYELPDGTVRFGGQIKLSMWSGSERAYVKDVIEGALENATFGEAELLSFTLDEAY